MRIAVLADTHNKLPSHVVKDIQSANEIWHLGDFTTPSICTELQNLGSPFQGVRGNCDYDLQLPKQRLLRRYDRLFLLIHIPPAQLKGADFLLHGHTHVPRDEHIGTTRVLNPGTVGKPNHGAPPSYAWLEINQTGDVIWKIVLV